MSTVSSSQRSFVWHFVEPCSPCLFVCWRGVILVMQESSDVLGLVSINHVVAVKTIWSTFAVIVIRMVVINVSVVIPFLNGITFIFVKIVVIFLVMLAYFVKILLDVVNVQVVPQEQWMTIVACIIANQMMKV